MAATAKVEFVGVDAGLEAEVNKVEKMLNQMGGDSSVGFGSVVSGIAGGAAFAAINQGLEAFSRNIVEAIGRNDELSTAMTNFGEAIDGSVDVLITAFEPLADVINSLADAIKERTKELRGPEGTKDPLHIQQQYERDRMNLGIEEAEANRKAALAANRERARMSAEADEAAGVGIARGFGGANQAQFNFLEDESRFRRGRVGAGRLNPFDAPIEIEDQRARPMQGPSLEGAADPLFDLLGGFADFGSAINKNVLNNGVAGGGGFDAQMLGGQELFRKIQEGAASTTEDEIAEATKETAVAVNKMVDDGVKIIGDIFGKFG